MNNHTILPELLDQIKQLNQELSNDKQAFIHNNQIEIEENNNRKITISNTIEVLAQSLQKNINLQKDPLWSEIEKTLMETSDLIQINQSVIQTNQTHYLNLLHALINCSSIEDTLVYEQHSK